MRWRRHDTLHGGWVLATPTGYAYVTRREAGGPWVARRHGVESSHRTLYGARMAMEMMRRCGCAVCNWREVTRDP